MDRRNVHRGLVALALAVGLMLAGVQPAAAKESGTWGLILDRLLGVWDAEENGSRGLWDIAGGWFAEKTSFSPDGSTLERGAGLDPNGNSLRTPEDPSEAASPNG